MTKTMEHSWRNTDQQTVKRKTLTFKKIPESGDAVCKYEVYTRKRNLLMERGLTCSESNHLELPDTVTRVIKAHKWETFCQNPSPACIPLVREFYANYDPDKPDLVRVRGKLVDASASAINSLYFLTNHRSSFFKVGSKVSPAAMRDIAEELTGKRVTLMKANPTCIPWGDLKGGQDIWIKFIKSNLLPTPYYAVISGDSAILLYCIMVGKPINVGKVIAKQIRKCASDYGDLWFPSLITRLCERHNVLPSSCEPVQQPYPPLLLDELVESESDQQTNPSNQKTSLSDHDPSFPVASTSHHPWDPKYLMDKFGYDPNLPIPAEATENAPSLFESSCQSPLPTPQATSSQPLPPAVPSAPAAEPSSPPQTDLDELPIGLNTAKTKERPWINTENQKKKQKTTTQGSISTGNPQPLERILPFGFQFPFRFPADDAKEKYEVYTRKRNLFMERGFTCSESNQPELPHTITRVIKAHKWETFCQNPSPACIPLVREFYANYDAARSGLVQVRGKLVDASPSAINSIFSLTNHQSTLFDDVSNISPLAMSDIVDELTRRKVIVGKYYRPFSRYDLKKGPEIWMSFTKHNLFPTWDNFIGKELAILLYCIMVGKPINVGKVIAKQIRKCARLKSGGLWFPALITRLCKLHYALPVLRDPIQQPYSCLPVGFVERTLNYEPVESEHDQQTNLSNQQTSYSDHDPLFPVANTGHQSCDEFGSGPNLPVPAEATENAPPHFDSYQQSPPPTAQAASSQPLPPVAPLAPPAELSCLPQTDSDKLPAYFQIHIPGLPILAGAAENAPPHFDYSQQSPPPTAQATSLESLPPVAPSVLAAEPLSPLQTDSVVLQVSSPQCGTICVQGYNVKWSVAPILEAIFKKHGDIAAECLFKTASARSYFLEVVCEVVTRIETDDVIEKMEEIVCQVSDAEAANINVSWLRAHLEAIHKRKEAIKRSDLLMETKVNTSLVKRAAQKDLRERCEELMTAQERFEKAERCSSVLHLVEKNIKNTILEAKADNDLWVKRRVLQG